VFGRPSDFEEIGLFDNVVYHDLSGDTDLERCFRNGHLGTAHIATRVIQEYSEGYDYILHFDSDVVFRKESLSLILDRIGEGYDLVGPIRCYKNNMNGRRDLDDCDDVVQTYFYSYNKNKITQQDGNTLRDMVAGYHNPLGNPILDYFDPVSFDILNNGGKVYFLDPNDVGGLLPEGNRHNKYSVLNNIIDFGDNITHFGGIGSGMKFHNKGGGSTPSSYVNWALSRFGMYHKLFYGDDLNIPIDNNTFELINDEIHGTNRDFKE
tara:strand:- start:4197 stop:4991 length:795 start_codon:yes stop_codon:yes gene_type:complete